LPSKSSLTNQQGKMNRMKRKTDPRVIGYSKPKRTGDKRKKKKDEGKKLSCERLKGWKM